MSEQVMALNLVLQGTSLNMQKQSTALLVELVAEKRKARGGDAIEIDDATWEELVKDLKLRNKDIESGLLKKSRNIRNQVVEKLTEISPAKVLEPIELRRRRKSATLLHRQLWIDTIRGLCH
jgi:hypothetical protein